MSFFNIDYIAQEGFCNRTPITINQMFKVTVSISGYVFCMNTFRLMISDPESPGIQIVMPIEKIDFGFSSTGTTQVINLYSRNNDKLNCGMSKNLTVDFRNENKNESPVLVSQTCRISFI